MTEFSNERGLHNCGGRDRRDLVPGERRKEPEMFNQAKRVMWTGAGWCAWLAILCAGGAACNQLRLSPVNDGGGTGGSTTWQTFSAETDLVLAIDDAEGMSSLQTKMLSQLPALLDVLQGAPNGPVDLHVGVLTSDTGVGKFELTQYGCPYGGNFGWFQSAPRAMCTASPLSNLSTGNGYFETAGGANYSDSLANQIACVGAMGDTGCGFSSPLKSIRTALALPRTPAANQGFLRPQALLAVVVLSNKDDCSVYDDSGLGDPTQTRMSDPLGPFTRFRCNEFGHLCQINGALTHPPRGAASDLQGCVSNETSADLNLTKVADEVSALQLLKNNNPARILAAAITGPTAPYSIDMVQEAGAPEAHPQMHPSCQSATGESAEPAVRMQQWASALGGTTYSICADSFVPALQSIGQAIVDRASAMCFDGSSSPRNDGTNQPGCRVADLSVGLPAGQSGSLIFNCADTGGASPCWTAVDDPVRCGSGVKSLVIRRVSPAPASSYVGINCAPCTQSDLGCLFV